MTLTILTPYDTQTHSTEAVFLPGAAGAFEVLRNHAPIISTLIEGEIRWREGGEEKVFAIKGGAVMVKDNVITVCAE